MIRRWLWLLPPALAGAALRLFRLAGQVAGGDELHGVRAAFESSFPELLVTYLTADHCIPLAAYDRLLIDSGVALSEWHLRLPVLVSGIVFLAAAPAALARMADRRTAIVFAWLIAVSPALVLYSRIIRSYMPMTLLAAAAAWSSYRAIETGSRRFGALYAGLGSLAVYFHLAAAPFVLSSLVFLLGRGLLDRRSRRRDWRLAAALAAAIGAGLALFMVPARDSLGALIAVKSAGAWPASSTVQGVLELQAGSAYPLAAALFWVLAARGLWRLRGRDPRLFGYGLCLVAGQVAGLLLLRPPAVLQPLILHRYLLVALPVVLLWVACGLAVPSTDRRLAAPRRAWLAPVLGLGCLFLAGPLAGGLYAGSFMHRNESLAFHAPRAGGVPPPPVYRRLAGRGARTIVELPWPSTWRFGRVFAEYQRGHGLEVIVAPVAGLPALDRLAFRNMVAPEPAAILGSRAGFLLVHTRLEREARALDRLLPGAPRRRDRERRSAKLEHYSRRAARRAARLGRLWGPPDLEDRNLGIIGWDLERIRTAR